MPVSVRILPAFLVLLAGCQREEAEPPAADPVHEAMVDARAAFVGEYEGNYAHSLTAWSGTSSYEADTTFTVVMMEPAGCVGIGYYWQYMLLSDSLSLSVHPDHGNGSESASGQIRVSGDTTFISLIKHGWSPTMQWTAEFEGYKLN